MAVDRNAVINLHKSGKSNVEIAKRLDINSSALWMIKKFQETRNTLDRPGRRRKGSVRLLNSSKTQEKSCDETLAEAAETWPLQSV